MMLWCSLLALSLPLLFPIPATAPPLATTTAAPGPQCNFVLEVMFVQDFSSSFVDDMPVLQVKLVTLIDDIIAAYPGSKIGTATFSDKPLLPFGFPPEGTWFEGDWCYNVTSPVSSGMTSQQIVDSLISTTVGGGADWPENQLGAMYDLAINSALSGWSSDTHDQNGFPIVRVMVVSTDALYHKAGDAAFPPHSLPPHQETGNAVCAGEDYPTITQVADALKSNNIYTIFLCGNTTGEDVVAAYDELLVQLGNDVHGAAYPLDADSSDILTQMDQALDLLETFVCTNGTIDMVFSQDVTWSYGNDMPHFRSHAAAVMADIQADHPYSHFSVVSFGDKPLAPFGHGPSGDYCYKKHQSLTDDTGIITTALNSLVRVSGADWWESQLDGIISPAVDPTIGWRGSNSWNGFKLIKIIALATDAGYHQGNDAADKGLTLAPHNGGMVQCTTEEYPTWQLLGQVLLAENIHPIFVPTSDIAPIYVNLLHQLQVTYGIVGEVAELSNFNSVGAAVIDATRRLLARL